MSVNIIKGEDRTITVSLKNENGDAYDLTGNTEIEACFAGESGTISKTKTGRAITVVGSADCGKITIKLDDTDTSDLPAGTSGFTITITEASTDLRNSNCKTN